MWNILTRICLSHCHSLLSKVAQTVTLLTHIHQMPDQNIHWDSYSAVAFHNFPHFWDNLKLGHYCFFHYSLVSNHSTPYNLKC